MQIRGHKNQRRKDMLLLVNLGEPIGDTVDAIRNRIDY